MDELEHVCNNKTRATGTLTATVTRSGQPLEDFKAQQVQLSLSDSYIGAYGSIGETQFPESFIFVGLPTDFTGPTHPVLPSGKGGAEVYIYHFGVNGYARSGSLTDVIWDRQKKTFSGSFECEGVDDISRVFTATGEFAINYQEVLS